MSGLARRVDAFIASHIVAWEPAIAGLAMVYVTLGFAEATPAIVAQVTRRP